MGAQGPETALTGPYLACSAALSMSPKDGSPKAFERKERHSCDPKSSVKGHPKKEGAGGKFTFGKIGDEGGPQVLDSGDPNYDSEAETEEWVDAAKGLVISYG